MIDYSEYAKNVNAFPKEKLLQYAGKYVAWSEDGTDIIASADSIDQLIDAVDAKYPVGYEFTIGFVPAGPYAEPYTPSPTGTPLGRPQEGTRP